MNTHVLFAVFKRNFTSYFLTPTGYLFVCVLLMLSSFAEFWPNEFWNANLANLDQLSYYFPLIMLVFIPAITMGIWADESRQGTDELLLTIPAGDLEIVLGKYLAAVAIYSVALGFSLLCNYLVFRGLYPLLYGLGNPDVGLFATTYFGYWLLGLAMLAIGMVASFLTRNLTVAYVLGAALNAPLVFMAMADALPMLNRRLTVAVKDWSLGGQLHEFGRGILNLSGLVYFALLIAVMLYLSMVLIGRRHWVRGRAWHVLGLHFALRALALAVILVGVVYALRQHDLRLDATSERLSSLSPYTIDLVADLRTEYDQGEIKPVRIAAFVSPEVPESYIQTRLNLLSALRELKAHAGAMMELEVNDTERAGPVADLAKKRYNITAHDVTSQSGGAYKRDRIFLGVALTCGLEKVVLPFIDRGIPVEYELVRSLCTVTQQKRKRIGVIETDAPVFGRFSMQGMSPNWPIITELEKQYEVVHVNPSQPIPLRKPAEKGAKGEKGGKSAKGEKEEGFDVLLAIQPSAMGPQETDNFLAAVRAGQPAVIFEDPFTMFAPEVPGTSQPRHPSDPMMGMMMQQRGMPKGTTQLRSLWRMLGVNFSGDDGRDDFVPFASDEDSRSTADQIVWQRYSPFPRFADIYPEFVFINRSCGLKEPFCETDPISSKLQQLFFPAPGYIEKRNSSELKDRSFVPLVRTSANSGTVRLSEMILRTPFGATLNPYRRQVPGQGTEYVLAAHITGRLPGPRPPEEQPKDAAGKDAKAKPDPKDAPPDVAVNVVLVSDIDMLTEQFFRWREEGDTPGQELNFDNVTLVLNALDSLAGDQRFLELRKRRPQHRTLTRFDERTEDDREQDAKAREKCRVDFDDAVRAENEKVRAEKKKLVEDFKREKLDQAEAERRLEIFEKDSDRRLKAEKEDREQKANERISEISDQSDAYMHRLRGWYKMWAVIWPPILPLMLAGVVFFVRRAAEREGVSRNRLK